MPVQFTERVRTTDLDEARRLVAESYCPHELTLRGRGAGFAARHVEAGVGALRLFGLDYGTGDVAVTPVPFDDFVLVSRPVEGRFAARGGTGERQLRVGEAVALDAHTSYELGFEHGCRLLTLRVDRAAVEDAAAAHHGLEDPAPVRFALGSRPDPAARRTWDAVTRFLLDGPAGSSPLLDGQIERMVAAALVECFRVLPFPEPPARPSRPRRRAVERAVAFVEHSAGEDIGLLDIARAAEVSPRVLQAAFRHHLDTTPLRHLREVRLRRAQDELRVATREDTTVAEVAHRWGFGNLGRFAAEYERLFGRLPGVDLRS